MCFCNPNIKTMMCGSFECLTKAKEAGYFGSEDSISLIIAKDKALEKLKEQRESCVSDIVEWCIENSGENEHLKNILLKLESVENQIRELEN